MTDAPPIPLTSPDGIVYAYACPRCHHVRAGCEAMVQLTSDDEHFKSIVEFGRAEAESCCRCRRCKAPMDKRYGVCAACVPAEEAEDAERAAKWERIKAEANAAVEASLTHAKDREWAIALRDLMSDLSEDCWCAGWLIGCEYSLWDFVQNGPGDWGQGAIGDGDIARLRELSDKCGGWWKNDDEDPCELFVPMEQWLKIVEARG